MFGATRHEKAYLAPFAAFLAIGFAGQFIVPHFFEGYAFWMASAPRYWIFPLQTFACGALLIRNWRGYDLRPPAGAGVAVAIGLLAFLIWIAPQQWFGFAPRTDGFEPGFFGTAGLPYALNLALRFLRLVVVVPLVEEIFWRGFLLRYMIDQDFTRVPIGAFSWLSFAIVTGGFCAEHSQSDWPAALVTGALYNWVAYRTRSLSACVLTHAVTNLALGIYILRTGQWGFW